MQLSRFVAKPWIKDKGLFKTGFTYKVSVMKKSYLCFKTAESKKNKTMEELLIGLLNNKLAYVLIKEASLDPINQGRDYIKEIKLLAKNKILQVNIKATNPFDNAQASAGGVSTKINEKPWNLNYQRIYIFVVNWLMWMELRRI